jgi:hypothetical protein
MQSEKNLIHQSDARLVEFCLLWGGEQPKCHM